MLFFFFGFFLVSWTGARGGGIFLFFFLFFFVCIFSVLSCSPFASLFFFLSSSFSFSCLVSFRFDSSGFGGGTSPVLAPVNCQQM